jgi:peptidoglycan/xylan/chitin deacetylase (PgdA/CDA1 family)/glycosyltransferase involved in cell wall biosynthesis
VKVSVVVATYNRREPLRVLLESLFRQDLAKQDFEIVVVVDGSTDGTQAMLEALQAPCRLRFVVQPNSGQAAARNAGWHIASAPVVLFLDDDLVCPANLLSEHLAAHCADDHCIAVGRIVISADGCSLLAGDRLSRQLQAWERGLDAAREMRWPDDAYAATNCSVPRHLLERVGGFDPAFYRALEDHDLGLRLWAQGGKFVYVPNAVVEQRYDKTTLQAVRDERWYGRAEILLGQKHPGCLRHTLVARSAELGMWRRWLLRSLARMPILAWVMLGPPICFLERLPVDAPVREIGRRLLGIWMLATRIRAATGAVGGWRQFDATFSRRLSVLMYHHVGPGYPGTYRDLTVSPQVFDRHIATLVRHGYHGVTLAECLRWCRGEARLPARSVMVTFDDGYADLAEHAFPVLQRHGFGGVVFIVTREIAGTNSWDEARGSATHRLLTREQIVDWQRRGIEFGRHSRTHASLPALDSAQLRDETTGCRADLERLTGVAPVAFAYPYGEFDAATVEAVRGDFALAFTAEEGVNRLATDPHLLRRTMVMPGDSGRVVALRAMLGYSPRDVLLRWRAAIARPVKRLVNRFLPPRLQIA